MRILIQRVCSASVEVEHKICAKIEKGLLLFLGYTHTDTEKENEFLLEKVIHLRIFDDAQGKMNLSLLDVGGELLVVPQFTLYADTRRGRRPAFTDSAPPDQAKALFEDFLSRIAQKHLKINSGIFAAHMKISLINDGPVTIFLDSEELRTQS